MKPHERLQKARIEAGFPSAASASSANGWPQKTYYNDEKGLSSFRKRVHKYAEAFGVTPRDLTGDEYCIEVPTPVWGLPLIELTDIDAFTAILRGEATETEQLSSLYSCGPLAFGVKNPNRAMTAPQNARIAPGDILVFDPGAEMKEGDFVLARVPGEFEPLFRIYTKLSNGAISLAPLNPLFPARIIDKAQDIQIIGKLVFLIARADTLF